MQGHPAHTALAAVKLKYPLLWKHRQSGTVAETRQLRLRPVSDRVQRKEQQTTREQRRLKEDRLTSENVRRRRFLAVDRWQEGSELDETIFVETIEHCYLTSCRLQAIPDAVGRLRLLVHLDVFDNRITELSVSLCRALAHAPLRTLRLAHNHLTLLPNEIALLDTLEILDVAHNDLVALPHTVGSLSRLLSLDASQNHLRTLPHDLDRLVSLRALDVSRNRIRVLPDSLGGLLQLRVLNLSDNRLTCVPLTVSSLQHLRCVRLQGNPGLPLHQWPFRPSEPPVVRLTRTAFDTAFVDSDESDESDEEPYGLWSETNTACSSAASHCSDCSLCRRRRLGLEHPSDFDSPLSDCQCSLCNGE